MSTNDYTAQQRKALHLWVRKFVNALNEAGLTRKRTKLGSALVDRKRFLLRVVEVLVEKPGEAEFKRAIDLADELFNFRIIKGEIIEEDWTMETFKDEIYKTMLKALTGKESTEEQTGDDIDNVYKHINRHMGQTHGITVTWPNIGEYQ